MKKAPIIFSACASLMLAAAICASPAVKGDAPARSAVATAQDAAPQTQSASGTIASVDKNSFTLTVSSTPVAPKAQSFAQDAATKTMTFVIDSNTTVDGKLKVNASADVTYRLDANGSNVAINVRVAQ